MGDLVLSDSSILLRDRMQSLMPSGVDIFMDDARSKITDVELKCRLWRLNNLYWVRNEDGKMVRFRMREEQFQYWHGKGNRNIILKCRQLGFSTLIQIEMLDSAIFERNFIGCVISYDKKSAAGIFRKLCDAYDRLPVSVRRVVSDIKRTAEEIHFSSGGIIGVGTTARGGTLSQLHISEYGKICVKYPDKAREIRSGAMPAVPLGGRIDIESTAEGDSGDFYESSMLALSEKRRGIEPHDFGFKFFFFPWWSSSRYALPDRASMVFDDEKVEYFKKLEVEQGIVLSDAQKAWYELKSREQKEDMRREFPSYPEEAFSNAIEGAIYAREFSIADSRGMIRPLAIDMRFPVFTAWDIGFSDDTTIVFFQMIGEFCHIIDCYANCGEAISHYVEILDRRGYWYGEHYLPHDADKGEIGSGKTIRKQIEECGLRNVKVLPRTNDVISDISMVRGVFNRFKFCSERCVELLKALRAYQREWDSKRGVWKDRPKHDWASHYADAFRYTANSLSRAEKSVIGNRDKAVFSSSVNKVVGAAKAVMGYENRRRK